MRKLRPGEAQKQKLISKGRGSKDHSFHYATRCQDSSQSPANLVLASAPKSTSPLGSLPQEKANWSPPTLTGRVPGPEPEESKRDLSVATRWRCGSGDSGSCLTPSPRTKTQDPWGMGSTRSGLPQEGPPPEGTESGCGVLSSTRHRNPPPLPPPSWPQHGGHTRAHETCRGLGLHSDSLAPLRRAASPLPSTAFLFPPSAPPPPSQPVPAHCSPTL